MKPGGFKRIYRVLLSSAVLKIFVIVALEIFFFVSFPLRTWEVMIIHNVLFFVTNFLKDQLLKDNDMK